MIKRFLPALLILLALLLSGCRARQGAQTRIVDELTGQEYTIATRRIKRAESDGERARTVADTERLKIEIVGSKTIVVTVKK